MKIRSLKFKICLIISIISNNCLLKGSFQEYTAPTQKISNIGKNLPNERFIINTDRDLYFISEEVGYEIWGMDDIDGHPGSFSSIIYIELMDRIGLPIVQHSHILKKGVNFGSFILPSNLQSGTYYLRAYSNWQKNFSAEFYATKDIQVINPYKPPQNDKSREFNISIFPEGGRIIQGVNNQILIKVQDKNGIYCNITEAKIMDNAGDSVSNFEFISPGIGHCMFYPRSGKLYKVLVPGKEIDLQVHKTGLILNIEDKARGIDLNIKGEIPNNIRKLKLIARNHNGIWLEQYLDYQDGKLLYSIHTEKIPYGITEFILADSSFNTLSKRLYNKVSDEFDKSLEISLDKENYGMRDTVKLSIEFPDSLKMCFLSMSIVKDIFLIPAKLPKRLYYEKLQQAIVEWDDFRQFEFKLSEDISEKIINLYLISSSFKKQELSLFASNKTDSISFVPEISLKCISGSIKGLIDSKPITNEILQMYYVSKNPYILRSKSDADGNFSFIQDIVDYGKQEVVIQPEKYKYEIAISFDYPFDKNYIPYKLNYFYFDSIRYEDYDRAFVNWQINMNSKTGNIQKIEQNKESLKSIYSKPDIRYKLDDYVQMLDLKEEFKEVIEGASIKEKNGISQILVNQSKTKIHLGENPLILFNGYPVKNLEEVLGLPVGKVDFIDLVQHQFCIGPTEYDGLVNIVTKDIMVVVDAPENAFRTVINLYDQGNKFPQPDQNSRKNNPMPDLRPTLYWEPDLLSNMNYKNILVPTGDEPGNFVIKVRGMDSKGRIFEIDRNFIIK